MVASKSQAKRLAAMKTKYRSENFADQFKCPGRPMSPCHSEEFIVYASLTMSGEAELLYRCSQCRLPVTWKEGKWQTTEK